MQGMDLLKEIRKESSLVYVVMMSANDIKQISLDLRQSSKFIIDLINEDYIFYIDKSSSSIADYCTLIDKISTLWDVRLDSVIEQWLARHKDEKDTIAIISEGKAFTWGELAKQVRLGTNIGLEIQKMLTRFFVYYNISKEVRQC